MLELNSSDLDDDRAHEESCVLAARPDRSLQAESNTRPTDAVGGPAVRRGLGHVLLARFGEVGGVDLPPPVRADAPRPADLPD